MIDPNRQIRFVGGPNDGELEVAGAHSDVFTVATINSETGEPSAAGRYRYDRQADVYRWEEIPEETAGEGKR